MERLTECRVAVFGIGGVGGYVCEALARSGSNYNSPDQAHSAPPKVTILPAGEEARDEFGHRYGSQQAKLTQE